MNKQSALILMGCMLLAIGGLSCKKKAPQSQWTDTLKTGAIRIAADTDFRHWLDTEISSFEAHNEYQAALFPTYTDEADAIRLLTEDSVRVAIVTRDLATSERAKLTEKHLDAKKHLIAFDGIAVITNRENTDSILSIATLQKILKGEITDWSQIRTDATQKSTLGTIRVLFDNKKSGIWRYAVDSIARTKTLSPNIYPLNGSAELIEKIEQTPNALGFISANLVSGETGTPYLQRHATIRLTRLSRDEQPTLANSYLPFAGDIQAENYPLWRPVYAVLSDPKMGLSSGFSIFLAQAIGQKIALKSGFLPVTDAQNMDVLIKNEYPAGKKSTKMK
ncbi:MAG: substrate-binding domain-containing protein [Candidatus Symbiothrix sp.]|jgi:phosphate transport system substrate-binding protein|nr:substrate-binding domain-containing protein [Candidatus Symbiothrix sp.]